MSRCIALVPSSASSPAWGRCARIALRGDRFCSDHRHALDGALMGFLDTKEYRHAQANLPAKPRREFLRRRKRKTRPQTIAETNTKTLCDPPCETRDENVAEIETGRRRVREIRVDGSSLSEFFGS